MNEKLLDKLAKRLANSKIESQTETGFQFEELSEFDWDAISAAHVSNHASVHYSSP